MSLLYPQQRDKNSSKWKHKQRILLLYFPGITQGPIYHTPTLAALKKHYPARFTLFNLPPCPEFCMHFHGEAHITVWLEILSAARLTSKHPFFPPLGNHLTNASPKPPHTSILLYRCSNSLESLLGEISSLTESSTAFSFPHVSSWRIRIFWEARHQAELSWMRMWVETSFSTAVVYSPVVHLDKYVEFAWFRDVALLWMPYL